MMQFVKNPTGRGGYWRGERISIAYRGFRIRPFLRFRPMWIGSTRLFRLGPLGLFLHSPEKRS